MNTGKEIKTAEEWLNHTEIPDSIGNGANYTYTRAEVIWLLENYKSQWDSKGEEKPEFDLKENEYLDFSKMEVTDEVKKEFINSVSGMCCKELLKVFLGCGLNTHIEQMVTNEVDGKRYILTFQTYESFLKRFKEFLVEGDAEKEQEISLINAYEEYIHILMSEITDMVGICSVHGWTSKNILRGAEIRDKITRLRQSSAKSVEKEQSEVLYKWVKASDDSTVDFKTANLRIVIEYAGAIDIKPLTNFVDVDYSRGRINTASRYYLFSEIEWLKPVQSEIELLKNRIAELESQNKKAISEDELNSIKQKSFNEGHSKGYQLANSDNDFED